jgi:hypothetical protein
MGAAGGAGLAATHDSGLRSRSIYGRVEESFMNMVKPFVPRSPVLPKPKPAGEAARRPGLEPGPARGFQVLQSRSAPQQLCLFLRHGAIDVK